MSEYDVDPARIEEQARVCDVAPETYAFWLGFFQGDYTRTTFELLSR